VQEVVGSNPAGPIERKAYKSKRFTLTRESLGVRLQSKGFVEFSTKSLESTNGTSPKGTRFLFQAQGHQKSPSRLTESRGAPTRTPAAGYLLFQPVQGSLFQDSSGAASSPFQSLNSGVLTVAC
jgi:hypothetical protein